MKFGFESLLVIVFRLQNTDFILRSASAFFLILSLILKSHMNTWHIDFPCMLKNCSISRAIQSILFSVSFMAHQVVCSKIRMKHSSLYTENRSNPLLDRLTKCALWASMKPPQSMNLSFSYLIKMHHWCCGTNVAFST